MKNVTEVKGYSHEKFKIGSHTVYKYTNDIHRKQFVERQFYWLNIMKDKFPEYGFSHLYLISEIEETGFSMNKIDAKPMNKNNAADLVRIARHIKLPASERFGANASMWLEQNMPTNFANGIPPKLTFEAYIEYLKKIVLRNPDLFEGFDWFAYEPLILKYSQFANSSLSYFHGDFTVDNILWDGEKYTLIDPNFKNDMWPSYLLDLSKLFQETRFSDMEFFNEIFNEIKTQFNFNNDKMNFIELLEIGHYIRMIPYVVKYPEVFKVKLERLQIIAKHKECN
ncbi:MAG: hypothetical protein WC979_01860 [Candidatus Pacearchaeota archaeon]|jgi:thiamine kinase-like enzyme|nr:hypothetical protein [Clostridia bacterium]